MSIKLEKQPDDYTCGITCVKMISDFFKKGNYSVKELCQLCDFFKYLGTNSTKIKQLFTKLDIKYSTKNIDKTEDLKKYLKSSFVLQVIYLKDKTPHWIIIESFVDDKFKILDPYYGLMFMGDDELEYYLKYKNYKHLPKFIVGGYIGHHTILVPKSQ